jgi:hypothetical protein
MRAGHHCGEERSVVPAEPLLPGRRSARRTATPGQENDHTRVRNDVARLGDAQPHILEAEMKHREQS